MQSGDGNVAIGKAAMGGVSSPVSENVCVGKSSGNQISGDYNVCIGSVAGYRAAGGCVHIGANAGFDSTGVNNVIIGRNAGLMGEQRSGNWNTIVGPTAVFSNNVSKAVAIGYHSRAEKTGQNVIGSSDSVETKVFGDLVVHGTDGIDRRIVFNNDNTVTWEEVV